MNTKIALLTSLLILTAGVILTIIHPLDVYTGLIIILGIIFIVPGVVNIILLPGSEKTNKEGKTFLASLRSRIGAMVGFITSLGSVILGICMLLWYEMYVKFLPFIFGIILVCGGVYHLCVMAIGFRPVKLSWWVYIFPVVLLAAGFIIIYVETLSQSQIVMLTGAGLIIFAVNSLLELWFIKMIQRQEREEVNHKENASLTIENQ